LVFYIGHWGWQPFIIEQVDLGKLLIK
jgi:hypothetical protein